jgi:diguanylate cyclase (GGDEF)-like protein
MRLAARSLSPSLLHERLKRSATEDAPAAQKPPRLVLRFAVSTAILLSLGAFVILIFVRQHAIDQAESAAVFHARFVVRSVVGERLVPSDFARPVAQRRSRSLDRLMNRNVLVGETLAITLHGPDGRVTYATDPSRVGTTPPDAPKARAALDGTVTTAVSALTVDGSVSSRKVFKVFVPVVFAGSPDSPGVLELAQDYEPIAHAGRKGLLPVIGILQLVLLTLYVSLFPLLRRVTARLRGQVEQIEKLALYDALTGLANRRLFRDRVEQALLSATREGEGFSLMLLDLDRFKEINDTLGHQTGDAVLEEFATRLRGVSRASDTVARLGGDEFALVLLGARDGASALFIAERIRRALEKPFSIDGLTLQLETSIGIAVFPEHGEDAEMLLRNADIALYASKEAHVPVVYASKHNQHSPARLGLVGETRRAIENEELVLHYQPEVDLATGETSRVEALVRWLHPEHGLLLPEAFIPIARQSALIRPITRYVLDTALRQCRVWQDAGIQVAVAVNLAERDLADSHLEEEVSESLRRWKLDAEMVELEIPESAVMTDPDRVRKMLTRLSGRGVRLAIDDFGSGYASLSHLKQLPVDVLKIDKSFVQNLGTNEEDEAIVRSTIELAHSLGIVVVAEGVESEETLERLTALGCDMAQGYSLSRPLPADELTPWLEAPIPRRVPKRGGHRKPKMTGRPRSLVR